MFAEKLGRLMQNMLFGKTKYITVAVSPGEAQQQALPPDNLPKHVDYHGRQRPLGGAARASALGRTRRGHRGRSRNHPRERRLGH